MNKNLKKTFIVISLFILVVIQLSCSTEINLPVNEGSEFSVIEGKIKDHVPYPFKVYIIMSRGFSGLGEGIFSTSDVDPQGNFRLENLLTKPTNEILSPPYPSFDKKVVIKRNTIQCSDSSAQITNASFFLIKKENGSNILIDFIYRRNYNNNAYSSEEAFKAGYFISEFLYSNKNVSIEGVVTWVYDNIDLKTLYTTTLRYNLVLKKGWNRRVTYTVQKDVKINNGYKIVNQEKYYINEEPAGAVWNRD